MYSARTHVIGIAETGAGQLPKCILVSAVLLFTFMLAAPAMAQQGAQNGEWRYYGGDSGSTRYSPLDQIDKTNVKDLKVAWRWKAANYGPEPVDADVNLLVATQFDPKPQFQVNRSAATRLARTSSTIP